jgi:hypothetical protein
MPRRSRRQFLLSMTALLATESAACPAHYDGTGQQRRIPDTADRGRRFLASLYDPSVCLLPEFRGSKTYWLYHDNYLAAKLLDRTDPEMAGKVRDGIRAFGVTGSGKIEILFDEAIKPLPFRHHRLVEVVRIGEKVIKTEVVTEAVNTAWQGYTDLLFMAAVMEAREKRAVAIRHFEKGMATWDGTGFRDRVNRSGGLFATFKLALALIAASRLNTHTDQEPAIIERLLAAQRHDGGFITDYDTQGRPVGEANVETTSLAVLALDSVK